MKSLKLILFEKAYKQLKEAFRSDEGSAEYKEHRDMFCAYFELIVESGLEEEYYKWKEDNDYL